MFEFEGAATNLKTQFQHQHPFGQLVVTRTQGVSRMMTNVPKNELAVVVIYPNATPNGASVLYFPARGNHAIAPRFRPRALFLGETRQLSQSEGAEFLPKIINGVLHIKSRGDTNFIAK